MNIKLRELLNASKEQINNKDKEEYYANKKIIDEYFKKARNNTAEFYFAIFYSLFTGSNNGYIALKTNNKSNDNAYYTATIADDKKRLSNEDMQEIQFLVKHNSHRYPAVLAALNPSLDDDLSNRKLNELVIYVYIESEKKILPVLFTREVFEKIGFEISYQNIASSLSPASITFRFNKKTLDNFVDGVLNKKANYEVFITDKIIATIKASLKKIDEYNKQEEIKEKTIKYFEDKSLEYANELSLEICRGIIDNYNPSIKTIDTEMACSARTMAESHVTKEDLQLLDEYQKYSSKRVVFFPVCGDVKNITYRPILIEQLRTVLEEIGTTFEEDAWFKKIYLHTDRQKFVDVMNEEEDTKTK